MRLVLFLCLTFNALALEWPGVPSDPPTSTTACRVRLLLQPLPMELSKSLLRAKKLSMGLWLMQLDNAPECQTAILAREHIAMSAPDVPFLPRQLVRAVLGRQAAPIQRNLSFWLQSAAVGVAVKGYPPAALAVPVLGLLGAFETGRVPDLGEYETELPQTIALQPGQGATFIVWAGKVHDAHIVKTTVY